MSTGYNPLFLSKAVPLPKLSPAQKKLQAPLLSNPQLFELQYTHFSIVMHKERRFAFFAATNIDGSTWQASVKERTKFTKEKNMASGFQTGPELYDLYKSTTLPDFDQGHIAKFQDPQWGSAMEAAKAAADTMYYTNCVPQHHTLNRGAWKSLEDYIVKNFTIDAGADGCKISVFAGPVLAKNDPVYIQKIGGSSFQIPVLFWKIVVFRNLQKKLSAVAFMMSQHQILRKYNFVRDLPLDTQKPGIQALSTPDYFENFTSGEPYQVAITFVEKLTGLKFGLGKLNQPYKKEEPTELIYKRIEVPVPGIRSIKSNNIVSNPASFIFERIVL